MNSRLFKIKTFGCKVNQYETQAIREALLRKGYQEANNIIPVSLGELVLRVDTACIYAVSVVKTLIT